MYICVFVRAYVYLYVRMQNNIYVSKCIYTHILTRIHTHTHTRTHAHTRTHTSLAGEHVLERGVPLLGHERTHEHLAIFSKHQPRQELIFEMCSSHVLLEDVFNFSQLSQF